MTPNYKTIYINEIINNSNFRKQNKSGAYLKPEGMLNIIEYLENEYPEYEYLEMITNHLYSDDFVIMRKRNISQIRKLKIEELENTKL